MRYGKKSKPFYHTSAWKKARLAALERDNFLCVRCRRKGVLRPATTVHHIEHYSDCPEKALVLDNLVSLCDACHNQLHPERNAAHKPQKSSHNVRIIKI